MTGAWVEGMRSNDIVSTGFCGTAGICTFRCDCLKNLFYSSSSWMTVTTLFETNSVETARNLFAVACYYPFLFEGLFNSGVEFL